MHFTSRIQALLLSVTFPVVGLLLLIRSNTLVFLLKTNYIFPDLMIKACEKASKNMCVVKRFLKYGAKVSLTE